MRGPLPLRFLLIIAMFFSCIAFPGRALALTSGGSQLGLTLRPVIARTDISDNKQAPFSGGSGFVPKSADQSLKSQSVNQLLASSPAPVNEPSASDSVPISKTVPPVNVDENKEAGPTRQYIEEQLRSVQNAQQFDEPTKAELLKRYKAALDWTTASEEALKKISQYQSEIIGASESVAKVKSQLAAPTPSASSMFSTDITLQEMEKKLSQAELQLRELTAELAKREEELNRRNGRKAELTKLIDETRQRVDGAKKQLVSQPGNGEKAELVSALQIELKAHLAALEQQLQHYSLEIQRHDALAELLPLQRDLAQREKNFLEKQVAALNQAIAAKRKAESERQAREAREAKQKLANSHPTLLKLAEQNTDLAKDYKTLAESITKATDEVNQTNRTLAKLEADYNNVQEKVRCAGNSSSIGLILREKRSELPDTAKCEQRIRFVSRVMPEAYLAKIGFCDERAALGDLDTAVGNLNWSLTASHERDELEKKARQLLEKKLELLDTLINVYDRYLLKLSEIEIGNLKLVAKTSEFANYIDERVLWVRSANLVGTKTAKEALQGLLHFAKPGPWIELSKQCGLDAVKRPSVIFLAIASFGILIAVQTRLRKRLQSLCVVTSGGVPLKMILTLEGLFLNAAMTAPLPLFLLLVGWWLTRAEGIMDIGLAIGWGLWYSATLLWVVKFTLLLCKPGLLAESHFGWSEYSLAIARRHMRWLTYSCLPLFFVMVVTNRYHNGIWENSLGRIAFIGAMVLLAVFMHTVLFSKNNVLREILARNPDHWLARFSFILYLLAVGLPSSLAILAWVGYYYSAQQLALQLEETLALVLGLVLLHATVSRWFLVKRRNLAIAQMKERQTQGTESGQHSTAIVPATEKQQDLAVIHQQLQYLLGHAVVVCLLIGSWIIWADTLPALNVLDSKKLWDNTIEVVQIHEDALGNHVKQIVPVKAPTTARHALLAGLILFAAVVIGRHLPALLQITVLSRVHFDKGGRHAISILMRYLVALIGVIMACRTMSITWGSVQWLAAGITVGLGFGLQEIFANFVSGLILLFERPIRVGDIITLGDTTGTVTDIRIRTTTVTSWDRKELIVPNKELITGQLLNWTLSDPVNRIVVTVGVAYKTNTRKVHDLIMTIASEHPNVLEDPVPQVTFESFGDSTLNFVLRCYISSMDTRLDTINDLHEAIHDHFNQEGIEIAFPQRDLHIRSVEKTISHITPSE